jgi:hypothetical protein
MLHLHSVLPKKVDEIKYTLKARLPLTFILNCDLIAICMPTLFQFHQDRTSESIKRLHNSLILYIRYPLILFLLFIISFLTFNAVWDIMFYPSKFKLYLFENFITILNFYCPWANNFLVPFYHTFIILMVNTTSYMYSNRHHKEKINIFNKALNVGLQELGFGWVILHDLISYFTHITEDGDIVSYNNAPFVF